MRTVSTLLRGVVAMSILTACAEPTDPLGAGAAPDRTPAFAAGGADRATVLVNPRAAEEGTARSIQEGIDMVAPGGRVVVLPGTYEETLVINKGLTLEPVGGASGPVVITPPAGSGASVLITVTTVAPVTVRAVTLRGGLQSFVVPNVPADITIDDVTATDFTRAGIVVLRFAPPSGAAARATIRDSRFLGGAQRPRAGIVAFGDVDALIERNIVDGVAERCITVAYGPFDAAVETTADVVNNDLDRCGVAGAISVVSSSAWNGVRVANIIGNTIRNSDSEGSLTGIHFEGFTGRVEYNVILDVIQPSVSPAPTVIPGCCILAPAAILVGSYRGVGATPTVRFNDISGNAFAGLRVAEPTVIDAACNWWGDPSGPGGIGPGAGDAILVEPWASPPTFGPFAALPIARAGATSC